MSKQVFDENDFTLVKSITQGENLFEHKNGCLYIVEYEEVDDEEIHDFDNPTLYMDKDGNKVFSLFYCFINIIILIKIIF